MKPPPASAQGARGTVIDVISHRGVALAVAPAPAAAGLGLVGEPPGSWGRAPRPPPGRSRPSRPARRGWRAPVAVHHQHRSSSTSLPALAPRSSRRTCWPSATRSCFPPLRITAYIARRSYSSPGRLPCRASGPSRARVEDDAAAVADGAGLDRDSTSPSRRPACGSSPPGRARRCRTPGCGSCPGPGPSAGRRRTRSRFSRISMSMKSMTMMPPMSRRRSWRAISSAASRLFR